MPVSETRVSVAVLKHRDLKQLGDESCFLKLGLCL